MMRRPSAAEPAALAPDAEQLLTILARMTANLAVRCSRGDHSASFREIVVREMRIATHAEADAIEAWLTAHPRS